MLYFNAHCTSGCVLYEGQRDRDRLLFFNTTQPSFIASKHRKIKIKIT